MFFLHVAARVQIHVYIYRFLVRFSWLISWWFSLFVVTVEAHSTPLGICACLVISGNLVLQVSPLEFARMQGQPEDPKRKNPVFYKEVVPICQIFSFIYLFIYNRALKLYVPVDSSSLLYFFFKIEKYLFTCDWKWCSQNIIMYPENQCPLFTTMDKIRGSYHVGAYVAVTWLQARLFLQASDNASSPSFFRFCQFSNFTTLPQKDGMARGYTCSS
jgi:hypothetical protein